jgi:hypothetical protein
MTRISLPFEFLPSKAKTHIVIEQEQPLALFRLLSTTNTLIRTPHLAHIEIRRNPLLPLPTTDTTIQLPEEHLHEHRSPCMRGVRRNGFVELRVACKFLSGSHEQSTINGRGNVLMDRRR